MSKMKRYLIAFFVVILCCNVLVTVIGNNTAPLKAEIERLRTETEELRAFTKDAHNLKVVAEELTLIKKQVGEETAKLLELTKKLETTKAEVVALTESSKKTIADYFEAAKKNYNDIVVAAKSELVLIEKNISEVKSFSEKVANAEYERAKTELERLTSHVADMSKLFSK